MGMHPMSCATLTNGGFIHQMHAPLQSVPTMHHMGSLQSLPPTSGGAHMSPAGIEVARSGGAKIVGLINHDYQHLQSFAALLAEWGGFADIWQKIFTFSGKAFLRESDLKL